MELSHKIKDLEKEKGLSQLELAEELVVSRQAVSGWEAGTSKPSTENLQSLSRLFNISLETLLDDTAEVEPTAAPEKIPAEEQVKEEDKGQEQGKARRRKVMILVIVLLLALLTAVVLAHSGVLRENSVEITFGEMEHRAFDADGTEYMPIDGFD